MGFIKVFILSFQPILSFLRRRRRRSRLSLEPVGPIPPPIVVRRTSEQNGVDEQPEPTGKQEVAAQNVVLVGNLSAVKRRQFEEQTELVEAEEADEQLKHQGHVGFGLGVGRRLPIFFRTSPLQRRRRKRAAQSRKYRRSHSPGHSKLQKRLSLSGGNILIKLEAILSVQCLVLYIIAKRVFEILKYSQT